MSVDFLFGLRDVAQAIMDLCQAELDKQDPAKEESQKNIQYEAIPWVITQNQKGEPYERYPEYKKQPDTTNINYKTCLLYTSPSPRDRS